MFPSVEWIQNMAKEKRFTRKGEMFSSDNLSALAGMCFQYFATQCNSKNSTLSSYVIKKNVFAMLTSYESMLDFFTNTHYHQVCTYSTSRMYWIAILYAVSLQIDLIQYFSVSGTSSSIWFRSWPKTLHKERSQIALVCDCRNSNISSEFENFQCKKHWTFKFIQSKWKQQYKI